MVRFGKVPDDMVNAFKNDIERCPISVGVWFYSVLLTEYPELAEAFLPDNTGDTAEIGPKDLSAEPQQREMRHHAEVEPTHYHR